MHVPAYTCCPRLACASVYTPSCVDVIDVSRFAGGTTGVAGAAGAAGATAGAGTTAGAGVGVAFVVVCAVTAHAVMPNVQTATTIVHLLLLIARSGSTVK